MSWVQVEWKECSKGKHKSCDKYFKQNDHVLGT